MAQRKAKSTAKNLARQCENGRSLGRGELVEWGRKDVGRRRMGVRHPSDTPARLLLGANRSLAAFLTAQVDDRERLGPANNLGAGDTTAGTDDGAGRRTFGHEFS